MKAEAITHALLSGAGAVTAIVATRIYPVVYKAKSPTPGIVYTLISSSRIGALDANAPTHLARARVQLDLLTADHVVLRTLRDAVVAAMQFQRGAIAGATVHSVLFDIEGQDVFDDELRLYRRSLDFLISHEAN